MDREVIHDKLESLRRCVERVKEKRPQDLQTLLEDIDLQDILTLNLTRAVQLCVDIAAHFVADSGVQAPDTMGETFDALAKTGILPDDLATRLKRAVGFRNIVIHNYERIDWAIVHSITLHNLDAFIDFASAISSRLN